MIRVLRMLCLDLIERLSFKNTTRRDLARKVSTVLYVGLSWPSNYERLISPIFN